MSRRLPRVLSAWLCAATQGVAVMSLTGLILCFGDGGHVAVEPVSAEDCCATRLAPAEDEALSADAASCRCTHVPILQPAAQAAPAKSEIAAALSLPAAPCALRVPRSGVSGIVASRGRERAVPESIRTRRSVVLLA